MNIETIINGGAVGLCAFSLYIIWKLAGNHINHNTEVLAGLREAIVELTTYLRQK